MGDAVSSPIHYNSHPSKIEAINIADGLGCYCLGNVFKYVARHEYKGKPVEDLKKAIWYLDRRYWRDGKGLSTVSTDTYAEKCFLHYMITEPVEWKKTVYKNIFTMAFIPTKLMSEYTRYYTEAKELILLEIKRMEGEQ